VAHVGQEAGLGLVGPPQVIRLLIQLRIQGNDAAIGIFELAVEVQQLRLTLA
jgi:hypothetical protein